jgi:hypothetical protein
MREVSPLVRWAVKLALTSARYYYWHRFAAKASTWLMC